MRRPWSEVVDLDSDQRTFIYANGKEVAPGETPRSVSERELAKLGPLARRRARMRSNVRLVRTIARATKQAWRTRKHPS